MIKQLLVFEIQYQRKQWALYIGILIFFLSGFQIGAQGFALNGVNFNAPYQITHYTSIFTLGSVFVIMFFAINGVLREQAYKAESLIYSSGLKKYPYFISRFLGVFFFSVIAFSPIIMGTIFGTYVASHDPSRLSPFSFAPYLLSWTAFIIPNILICSSIIFSVGIMTKNRLSIYATALLIYVIYFVCSFYFNSPILANSTPENTESMLLAALGDPFGIAAFIEQSQYWTPAQKNILNVSLSGNFLLNRIIWIAVSFAILSISYKLFSFTTMEKKLKKAKGIPKDAKGLVLNLKTVVKPSFSFKADWISLVSQTRIGIKQVLKSFPFWVVMGIWGFVVISEIYNTIYQGGTYSEKLYPLTYLLIELFQQPLFLLGLLLIIFYSGEVVWKERDQNFHHILDATPVSNSTSFLSKLVTLSVIPILLITLSILISIGFQLAGGFYQFDFPIYISMFYYQGVPLLFMILLAIFLQSTLPNKYLAMTITGLMALVFTSSLSASFGIEHPLLRIGAIPGVQYTGMNGYGSYSMPFHVFARHWITLGLILTILSFKLWHRGISEGFLIKLKQIRYSWSTFQKIFLLFLMTLFCFSSGFIFYKTNIETEYLTSRERLDRMAEYERKYKKFENLDRLYPSEIQTEMALFPEESRYVVHANYALINKNEAPIDTILVTEREAISNIRMNRAELIEQNKELGVFLYLFNESIQLGDTVSIQFSIEKKKEAFRSERGMVNNGSYIHLRNFSPAFGYRPGLEIRNSSERRKRNLPPREEELISEADFNISEVSYGKIPVRTILSTSSDQVGISIGDLVREWSEDGRNYYEFKTSTPVSPAIGYFSADYEVDTAEYQGITIQHYFHKSHDFNNEVIMESTKSMLAYADKEFGVYPYNHLRIAEIPAHWPFGGYAHPGTIAMVEDNLYLVDERKENRFSLVAKRTIHEVAHQWWGHVLSPQNTSGAGIFVEGFAKYTEAVLMEKLYGKASIFQLSQTANRRYFSGRSYASTKEHPLYLEQGESYMLYGKSYTSMLAMKELIGEAKVNQVLKTLVERHQNKRDATLTSIELLEEFYKVTPNEYHYLIDDWFKRIITYDLRLEGSRYTKLENGQFEVELEINAQKFEHIDGIASEIDFNEPIPIGLLAQHPSRASDEEIIYLETKAITSGNNRITVIVDQLPYYVSIDPYGTRLDMVRNDNWARLDE